MYTDGDEVVGGSMILAIAGDALARNGGRGEGGRAGGLKVLEGTGAGEGAGDAVPKADRMGSKF